MGATDHPLRTVNVFLTPGQLRWFAKYPNSNLVITQTDDHGGICIENAQSAGRGLDDGLWLDANGTEHRADTRPFVSSPVASMVTLRLSSE